MLLYLFGAKQVINEIIYTGPRPGNYQLKSVNY